MKNIIAKKEKMLRIIQKNYPHLAHLTKTQLLAYFEVDTLPKLERDMHDNLINHNINLCSCTDSGGELKGLYHSEKSAKKEAAILIKQKRVKLNVYSCPNGCGWHLSKS